MQLRRIFLWTMIVSLLFAAAMGIAAILLPNFGRTQERILITSILVGAFSLPALGCSIVIGRRRLMPWMWTGLIATLLALLLWLLLAWSDPWFAPRPYRWWELVAKSASLCTVGSTVLAQTGLLMLLRLENSTFALVRTATIVASAILGGLIAIVILFEINESEAGKLMAVLAILAVCGTIVTPVLGLVQALQRRASRESIPSSVKVELVCPRCAHRQLIAAGAARCAQCNLRINIEVEEPRCECGYLLYQLQGAVCPECGRNVRQIQND